MKRLWVAVMALQLGVGAQQSAPASSTLMKERKEIFRNAHVVAYLAEGAPGDAVPLHTHEHATLNVFLTAAHRRITVPGKPAVDDVRKRGAVVLDLEGTTHTTQNVGKAPIVGVSIDFSKPQGKVVRSKQRSEHYCNAGSRKQCVDERYLFCTDQICVEDVTFAPGAISTKHAHMTDHMLIAISDYQLQDDVEGKGTVTRTRKSGEVEYIPAGITHQLTNTGLQPARFIVVAFK
jgi:quercetin dioxygenase-like cupin family protein